MLFINTILISLISFNVLFAKETKCLDTNKSISASLITDNFYKYEEYIHYSLGNFTNKNNTNYTLKIANNVKSIESKSDLIFGEHYDLKKISNKKNGIKIPHYIKKFYQENLINNLNYEENLYPLDLDIFVITSKKKIKEIKFEEDLYEFNNQLKYTLTQSFYSNIENIKFINHLMLDKDLESNHPLFESILFKQSKKYLILNKNTFLSKYEDLILSYYEDESIFQVNTDGYAYKEKLDFIYYPNFKNIWNDELGKFSKNLGKNIIPSFFGFSVIVNSQAGYNYLCYITQPLQRDILVSFFDLGISPLSKNDILNKDNISNEYKNLLNMKNNYIKQINLEDEIFDKYFYQDYLNFIVKKDLSILNKIRIELF